MKLVVFYLTMNTTQLMTSGTEWAWVFSTHELHHRKHTTPSKFWVKCHRKMSIRRQRCYLRPPAAAAALCEMPAFASDVTSSLHRVWIPMASSLFGCHATLVLCCAGTECILGVFSLSLSLSLPVCCSRVREAINKHCAFMVRSCVAQQGITHAAWLVLHSALLRRWRAHWIHQSSCTWVTYW